MAGAEELQTLKTGPNRTVLAEEARDGGRRLVKRFHGRGAAARWLDPRRARRELRVLEALRAAGLPVPAPLEVRHAAAGWELVCAWIPDAVPLRELYLGRAPWPRPPAELARALGRLLARAHAAGLEHGDPHAGNVLVDTAGRPWLVDFTHARLRGRMSERAVERELVALAADAREHVPFGFRARVLAAWCEASGRRGCGPLAARIEARARARRREVVARSRARWRRESGVCRAEGVAGGVLLARRELGEAERARLAERLRAGVRADGLERGGAPDGGDLLLLGWSDPGEGLRRWAEAGRFDDHRLPAARPLALLLGAGATAAFALPPGARRATDALPADGAGRLAGALYDRGLGLHDAPLWTGADGELVLDPRSRVTSAPGRMSVELDVGRERARFVEAFLSELRGGPAERCRLRAELERG